ncbi:zinc finger protein 37-like, partial [Arapaima gigas]
MTKLQSLNAYVTERLMVAAREIVEVVSDTVLQFQEEVGRARRENERLRQRLQEVGFHAQAILHGERRVTAETPSGCPPALSGRGTPEAQQWSSGLKEDTEPSVTGGKQENAEQRTSKQEHPELGVQRADSSGFRLTSDKSPSDEEFFQPLLADGGQTAESAEGGSLCNMLPEQVKVEPDTGDCSTTEEP